MNAFQTFFDKKYGYDSNKTKIELIESKLRKELFHFEITPLKTKESIINFKKEKLFPTQLELISIRNQIKGFNWEGCLLGIAIYHTCVIFYKKQLLNEMGKTASKHLNRCAVFGVLTGLLGYSTSYSLSVFTCYNQTLKNVENLIKDYDYFYVTKHEQEFEE